jgi:hypothetical protein
MAGFSSKMDRRYGQNLVAADIERSERDRFAAGRIQNLRILSLLIAHPGKRRGHHELEFCSEQPNPGSTGLFQMRQIHQKARIHLKGDFTPSLVTEGLLRSRRY